MAAGSVVEKRRATRGEFHVREPGRAGRVRIIGGSLRRTPLPVADAPGLRPTPDRVRETIFNWLAHLLAALEGARGLDLFAGSGALGFELASRGAGRVVLVERDAKLAASLSTLAQRLASDAVQVMASDWKLAISRLAGERFDVIFLDPPFDSGLLEPAARACKGLLAPGGLLYLEGAAPPDPGWLAREGLQTVRAGRAGAVHFQLLRHLPPPSQVE
jgi:16S rRNA (guanine966-N2)-methyltransferase